MIRTLFSLGSIVFIVAVVATGTVAFFSDEETSTDNVFTAGAIDLLIDNDSYYNGNRCVDVDDSEEGEDWQWVGDADWPEPGTPCTTSFPPSNLDDGLLFFDFTDLKPDDEGEDTISIHVDNNDAWACMNITVTSNDENGCTESEEGEDNTCGDPGVDEGELADAINFIWWADDGDNVLEANEEDGGVFIQPQSLASLNYSIPLADATGDGILSDGPLVGGQTYFIGKAWCFGELTTDAVPAGQGVNPSVASGILCNGENLGNETQTDSVTGDIMFTAVQSRNNDGFICDDDGPGLGCQDLDIMLVMDNSGSIEDDEETLMQSASVAFMNAVGLGTPGSHAGLASFATDATLSQMLTDDLVTITAAINADFSGGSTNLASGIDVAVTELTGPRDRDDATVPDVMIILTDGNPNIPSPATGEANAITAANAARAAGIEVYVVGIGDDVDEAFLEDDIADDPAHYFSSANFADLEDILVDLTMCENGDLQAPQAI